MKFLAWSVLILDMAESFSAAAETCRHSTERCGHSRERGMPSFSQERDAASQERNTAIRSPLQPRNAVRQERGAITTETERLTFHRRKKQRQQHTLHIQKDVLAKALRYLLCPVAATETCRHSRERCRHCYSFSSAPEKCRQPREMPPFKRDMPTTQTVVVGLQ